MSSNKETKVKKSKLLQHWQAVSIYLTIYDFIAVNLAYFLALWLRFDCHYAEIQRFGYIYSLDSHHSMVYFALSFSGL